MLPRIRLPLPPFIRRRLPLAGGLLLLLTLAFGWPSLPDPLFDAPYSTVLLSREGQLLGARISADEQWRFPPSGPVPERFAQALLEYEDRRFFRHPGVDPLALGRALWLNLRHGRVVSGGSTITMQTIRLSRGNPPRTLGEKALEALLALRLEWRLDKPEILALYAAHAPFGGNVVGLDAAAWRYFGRAPQDLSWAETATLAILPNSPGLIHPGRNRERLRQKRDALLQRLHQAGRLDALDLRLAMAEPLPEAPLPLPEEAPHLLETLRQQQGAGRIYRSTIERPLQLRVNELLARHHEQLARQGIHNAAALVIDNRSLQVLAYVGNTPDDGAARGHQVDIIQRPRSTGSLLKPFLYAAMLQTGELLPTTLVADIPTQIAGYMPENFDRQYRGAVPAREALARSLNVPAVRLLRRHGVARFQDLLTHLGMTSLHRSPDQYGLSLILGGAEGKMWELASLYANLARTANLPGDGFGQPLAIPSLLLDTPPGVGHAPELGKGAVWLTLDALLEVNRPGVEGFWRRFAGGRRVAWKTGTSFGMRDAWAIGVDPGYTVAVWVGNASGEGRPELTGSNSAAPLLFDLFDALPPAGWFPRPDAFLKAVQVCRKDGYLADGECERETQWAPLGSHFAQVTPYHPRVHLDPEGRWQVHAGCEPVAGMRHLGWFVLPPTQALFYRRHHPDYRPPPPWREDCRDGARDDNPIGLLYPEAGTRLYIPIELSGARGRTVFRAVHRRNDAVLFWHIDDEFVGRTQVFHDLPLDLSPGPHRLILVDGEGNRMERDFEVMGK